MTSSQETLEAQLREALQPTFLLLEDKSCGCGTAYDSVVVSPLFEGLKILARQRLVNKALGKRLEEIHAFSMQCFTPAEWEKRNQK